MISLNRMPAAKCRRALGGMTMRLVLATGLLALGLSATASAAAGPAFKLSQFAMPTHFSPGATAPSGAQATDSFPQYAISAMNVGGGSTSGPLTIVDTLPAGVTPAAARVPAFSSPARTETGREYVPCAVAGQTVTCTVTDAINPGELVHVAIPVDVDAGAPSGVTNQLTISGGGAPSSASSIVTPVDTADAAFGFLPADQGLFVHASNADGGPATQAGSHPYSLTIEAGFPSKAFPGDSSNPIWGADTLRNLTFDLPPGVVVNPNATPVRCTEDQLASIENGGGCPGSSQIGVLNFFNNLVGVFPGVTGLYNMVPPPGEPAELAFDILGTLVHVHGGLNGDFTLRADARDILAKIAVLDVQATLWGDPSDASHTPQRTGVNCVGPTGFGGCEVDPQSIPFLTMPSACSGPVTIGARADSWESSGAFATRSAVTSDAQGRPIGVDGCSALDFRPSIATDPTSHAADSPSGLDVAIDVPQSEGINARSTATLKKAVVSFPAGMSINPAAAGGLEACTDQQLGLGSTAPVGCPDAAKIGTATASTPLLTEKLSGAVYLRAQNSMDPESGEMFRVALVLENKERGLLVKLPGQVRADAQTGQLTTTFDDNPQLPVSDVQLQLKGGSRAPLATPKACGPHTIASQLVSWGGQSAERSSAFGVDCAPGLGGFGPSFSAGMERPVAGATSTFTVQVHKPDQQSDVNGISLSMPAGLLAHLKGNIGTRIGTARVAAGPGSNPFWLSGPVVLEGPYGDAPFSLRVTVPAVAGPFNLGDVVVRQKIYVDPITARVTVVSDPLPTIVKGVPVRLQDLQVAIDKAGFMLNPTDCTPKAITGTLGSAQGATAAVSSPFQVAGCPSLDLKPKLALSLTGKGQTTDGKHPGVSAVLTQAAGEANLKKVEVRLPLSLALDPDNANGLCEFADGSKPVPTCPASSIVGSATAVSPILNEPLTGPAYFVKNIRVDAKSGRQVKTLPKVVIPLVGENGLRLTLTGTSAVPDNKHLVTTFDLIPDAPVSRFELKVFGGKHGILTVSDADVCKANQIAHQQVDGQNGKQADADITMGTPCPLGVVASSHSATALKLTVGGIAAGKVTVSGKAIKKTTRTVKNATTASLAATLTAAAKSTLARHRNVKTKITVTFIPAGAKKAITAHKTLTIHGAKAKAKR